MSILTFEMEDIDSRMEKTTFNLLNDFLQPGSALTLNSTAQKLLALLPEKPFAIASTDNLSFNLLVIAFGEQIPYHHPSQHKLAALLERLGESSRLTEIIDDVHLDWLGSELRDSSSEPDTEHPDRYVNFQAFSANLFERRLFRTDSSWAEYALSEAHEGIRQDWGDDNIKRDIVLMGAAQWIFFYGQSLFKQVIFPGSFNPTDPDDSYASPGGPLYHGKPGLCLERWHFWRDGFNAVALGGKDEEKGPSQACRELAAKAADLMEALEENMTF